MVKSKVLIALIIFLGVGCATLSESSRVNKFERISKAYKKAMSNSDFEIAYQFVDPEKLKKAPDINTYKNIKIVDYEVKKFKLSEDKLEISQIAEISYYKLDNYILKKIRQDQVWKYNEKHKTWLLQKELPHFK